MNVGLCVLSLLTLLAGGPEAEASLPADPPPAVEPRTPRRLGLSYSFSGGPGFVYIYESAVTASADAFIGLGIWEKVSLGVSVQGTFMHFPQGPASFLAHRTSLMAQGRGGRRDQLYWAVGMGLGAVHSLRGGWQTPDGGTTSRLFDHAPIVLRMGWWQNQRPGRAQLFIALQATLDLYWEEFPDPAFGLALHVGVGRV